MYEQGRADERERGINLFIGSMHRHNCTDEQIVADLMEEYGLSQEDANSLMEKSGFSGEGTWEKLDEGAGKIDAADR